MRFFTTVVGVAVAATVSAQSSTASVATATYATLSPQQTCLASCDRADICCQAACVNVPCPNEADINATTSCAGNCVQGNGTQAETDAYAACQSSCISSYFLSATGTAAAASRTALSASTTGTGASASTTGASGSASHTGSSTGSASASAASATGNTAPETRVALAGAGLFGLIVAGLAL